MKYEPVMGLEVHVELNTKSKMFCRCRADYFGKEPNTHTCPVCLGLPGALPYINEEAINSCIKIGLALNCQVAEKSLFERKNYFYPDLAKGYQISQYRWPLTINGWIEVENEKGGVSKIRINRAHQEEDTGKLLHIGRGPTAQGSGTWIDFNRSGVPLVEIVTEPDFKDVVEIRDYAKKLQQMVRFLGVSNADMERGDMRLEANVSIRKVDDKLYSHLPARQAGMSSGKTITERGLPDYRVELKNINSFRFMAAAVEYEIKRQTEALEKGEKITQETRGWDEDKKCTYLQRSKEEAHDYRYFPEPDLPPLFLSTKKIQEMKNSLPELPWDKSKRYEKDLGIKKTDAKILSEDKKLAEFFEETIKLSANKIPAVKIANHIINNKINPNDSAPQDIVNGVVGAQVGIISDQKELERLAKRVLEENKKIVEDYKSGKQTAIQALIGGVMKLSKGKADPGKAKEILERLLKGS